jgi:hypothetical protein
VFEVSGKTAAAAVRSVPWLLLTLAVIGCGRTGQVSGKASYRDQPLPAGTVMLLASDGRVYDGQIQPDGTFQISRVPVGTAKVSVTSMTAPGQGEKSSDGRDEGRAKRRTVNKGAARSRIPTKYRDFDQSGLTVTVEKGATVALELKLK